MTAIRVQLGAIAAVFVVLGYSISSPATASASKQGSSHATDFSSVQRGRCGGAKRDGGGSRNVNVDRDANRNVNVNRDVNCNVKVDRWTA